MRTITIFTIIALAVIVYKFPMDGHYIACLGGLVFGIFIMVGIIKLVNRRQGGR